MALFEKMSHGFHANLTQALCDSDTDETSSKKRLRKSVDRTLAFLDGCLAGIEKDVRATAQ